MHNPLRTLSLSAAIACAALAPGAAAAQSDADGNGGSFTLELNNAQSEGGGCRLTYVATNETGADIEEIGYEVAVFDTEGVVDRLLILEFGRLSDGRTKVVQFDLAETSCDGISRLLVNGVAACSAADGAAPDCMGLLETAARGDIAFGM
jgi:hypothetical protein